MDYITTRELREKSGKVWQRIEAGEEMVVTRNGKPFALLVHTTPAQVELAVQAYRAARRVPCCTASTSRCAPAGSVRRAITTSTPT